MNQTDEEIKKESKLYTEKEVSELKQKSWREGYDLGVKNILNQNKEAIKIGEAILDVMDNRYEQAKEDY